MTLKRYRQVKVVFACMIALIVSQSIVFENYIVPIATVAVSALILLYLRGKVTEVIADERDYAVAGRAGLLAMQMYSWIAVIAMFILYANRSLNPFYEPVALTLAFAVCLLMILYATIFRYYDTFKLSKIKVQYLVAVFFLALIVGIAGVRFLSGEDNWICAGGQWVPHGQPSFPAPTIPCAS